MRQVIWLSAALATFGGGGAPNGQATRHDAAGSPAEYIAPGHWEGVVTNDRTEIAGALSEIERLALSLMAKPQRFEECITPEQAGRPSVFFGEPGRGCRIVRSNVANGAIDRMQVCDFGDRDFMMTTTGTYATDHYSMTETITVEPALGLPSQRMESTMTINAKRAGPCTSTKAG